MKVLQAKSDADVLVVLTAVELSRLNRYITVVDDDTYILILLLHPTDVDKDIFDALSKYKYTTRQSLQLSTSSARTRKFETVHTLHTSNIWVLHYIRYLQKG